MNMAGNPSRWSVHPPSQFQPSSSSLFPSQFGLGSSSSSTLPFAPLPENLELPPQSWSQLLVGGLSGGEDDKDQEEDHRYEVSHNFQQIKKVGNWEEQKLLNLNPLVPYSRVLHEDHLIKQSNINLEGHVHDHEEFQTPKWSHQHHHQVNMNIPHVSSPRSCVTSLSSSNMLDFSYSTSTDLDARNHQPDQSSECKSTATGGVSKKARVQPSSTQPPLKVRKEKLGDRITALHQLVSPFGKTDTASVLLEAIGYIRFLQGQIEALSSPYMTTSSSNIRNQINPVQGERNSVFPEDPGQLLNDICLKRKGGPNLQDNQDNNNNKLKDLKSRGLCLVRLSCTQHVGSDNGADFWAPAIGGGGF